MEIGGAVELFPLFSKYQGGMTWTGSGNRPLLNYSGGDL